MKIQRCHDPGKLRVTVTAGHLHMDLRAGRGSGQWIADVVAVAAWRPNTLIARAVIDDDHRKTWGNTGPGRMAGGWHVARCIGRRRCSALAYATDSNRPLGPNWRTAPKWAWWPERSPGVPPDKEKR